MNNIGLKIKDFIRKGYCEDCDVKGDSCASCYVNEIIDDVVRMANSSDILAQTDGCNVCMNKNGKPNEIWYMGKNNNLYNAVFCPSCGRKMIKEGE